MAYYELNVDNIDPGVVYVSASELRALTGVPRNTLYSHIVADKVDAFRYRNRTYFHPTAVANYMALVNCGLRGKFNSNEKQETTPAQMKMPETFVLPLKVFVGSNVSDVCSELCQLADRIGVRCEVDFNGVTLWARPGNDPLRLVDAFHDQLRSNSQYKLAQQ